MDLLDVSLRVVRLHLTYWIAVFATFPPITIKTGTGELIWSDAANEIFDVATGKKYGIGFDVANVQCVRGVPQFDASAGKTISAGVIKTLKYEYQKCLRNW